MPSWAEIVASVRGAMLLARGDIEGMRWFNLTTDGFFNSFAAMVLAIPGYALVLLERYAEDGLPASPVLVVTLEFVSYVLVWLSFPLVALFVTRFLGFGQRYATLVIVTNWGSLVQVAFLAAALLVATLAPSGIRDTILIGAMLVSLVYQWFLCRVALGSSGGVAFTLVFVCLLIGTFIDLSAQSFIDPADPAQPAVVQPASDPAGSEPQAPEPLTPGPPA